MNVCSCTSLPVCCVILRAFLSNFSCCFGGGWKPERIKLSLFMGTYRKSVRKDLWSIDIVCGSGCQPFLHHGPPVNTFCGHGVLATDYHNSRFKVLVHQTFTDPLWRYHDPSSVHRPQAESHRYMVLETRGHHCIPADLKLLEAKPIAHCPYQAQLGPFSNFGALEFAQSKFLRSATQTSK